MQEQKILLKKTVYLVQYRRNTMVHTAANWAQKDDNFTQIFYEQNIRQFWLPEEISLNGDLLTWKSMSYQEKEVYK